MTVLAVAPLQIGAYVLAAILVPFGIFMLWGGRDFTPPPLDDELHPPPPPRTRLHAFRATLTRATRTAFGLCSLITAWHAIAWTHPKVHLLHVPLDRWWVLALGVLIAVWSSLAMDRHFK
ncbi:MAG TPA: hypothetical protein VD997_15090 [Phycisphaerales bacterium]|nr:hypothetical protein [Phycisphaerales bacterium]